MRVLLYALLAALAAVSHAKIGTSRRPAFKHHGIGGGSPAAPTYNEDYYLKGTIALPYGGLVEPFEAYTYGSNVQQLIQYYGGVDSYIVQNNQMMLTIVPDGMSSWGCFQTPGPNAPTPLLPMDSMNYTFVGQSSVNGAASYMFQKNETQYTRLNTYTLYVSAADGRTPLMFTMLGYDILLESHFDQYVLTYNVFAEGQGAVNDSALYKSPPLMQCVPFPDNASNGRKLSGAFSSPLAIFARAMIGSSVSVSEEECAKSAGHPHLEAECAYEAFMKEQGRQDKSRQLTYEASARYVEARNRAARARGSTFRVALNRFADWTPQELLFAQGGVRRRDLPKDSPRRKSVAAQRREKNRVGAAPATHVRPSMQELSALPASVNWTAQGAVEPPPDQAICGSCWAHGAAGTIASSIFLKTGKLQPMSRQELMDCSWVQGNFACDGGEDYQAYEWIMSEQSTSGGNGGHATQSSYGKYLGADGICHSDDQSLVIPAQITGYVNVTSGDELALQHAVATIGPISISIDASLPDFTFYSSGVYDDPACSNGIDDLDHTVLLVGYGNDQTTGMPYWLVRNSWSTHWGDNGYVRFARGGNVCGVATAPTYVILA